MNEKDIACQIVRRWNLIGKTDHVYMYMYVAMAFAKLTGSISDCIWRQRGTVIESNVGQRETRRHTHTHTLSHVKRWWRRRPHIRQRRRQDETVPNKNFKHTAARVEAHGGFILLVV